MSFSYLYSEFELKKIVNLTRIHFMEVLCTMVIPKNPNWPLSYIEDIKIGLLENNNNKIGFLESNYKFISVMYLNI